MKRKLADSLKIPHGTLLRLFQIKLNLCDGGVITETGSPSYHIPPKGQSIIPSAGSGLCRTFLDSYRCKPPTPQST